MNPDADAIEVCDLLTDQKALLWRIHHAVTESPGKVMAKANLASFLLHHGLHISELVMPFAHTDNSTPRGKNTTTALRC